MTSATENQGLPVQSGMKTDSTDSATDVPESGQPDASENLERSLDEALDETFPASDPIAVSSARTSNHPVKPT
ncbi:hypothetical protein [Paraburkholderia sp. ZP32-5]|uniref:hypothetical protein n=1 Tax=Paraburkholderia sp. ZP32-5 TaxID=2883245 RepID=UPI001F2A98B1|nr:hypothetical protein [Paraburkholderia sp. ZP32-5]